MWGNTEDSLASNSCHEIRGAHIESQKGRRSAKPWPIGGSVAAPEVNDGRAVIRSEANHRMTHPPSTVRSTRLLIHLNALLWFAFGITVAIGAHPSYEEAGVLRWAITLLALLAAGILVALAGFLRRRNRLAYWLALALLAAITLADLLDEFGLADLALVIITILPLTLLLKDRSWYLQLPLDREQQNRPA